MKLNITLLPYYKSVDFTLYKAKESAPFKSEELPKMENQIMPILEFDNL